MKTQTNLNIIRQLLANLTAQHQNVSSHELSAMKAQYIAEALSNIEHDDPMKEFCVFMSMTLTAVYTNGYHEVVSIQTQSYLNDWIAMLENQLQVENPSEV